MAVAVDDHPADFPIALRMAPTSSARSSVFRCGEREFMSRNSRPLRRPAVIRGIVEQDVIGAELRALRKQAASNRLTRFAKADEGDGGRHLRPPAIIVLPWLVKFCP